MGGRGGVLRDCLSIRHSSPYTLNSQLFPPEVWAADVKNKNAGVECTADGKYTAKYTVIGRSDYFSCLENYRRKFISLRMESKQENEIIIYQPGEKPYF